MASNANNTTRRAMLGALAIMPIAVSSAAVAQVGTHQVASSGLTSLIEQYRRAAEVSAAYNRDVCEPLRQRWLAAEQAIPHIEVPGAPHYDGGPTVWSTADRGRLLNATAAAKRKVSFHGPGSENARIHHMAYRRLAAAGLIRQRAVDRAQAATGFAAVYEEDERLSDITCELGDVICAYPAATLVDLSLKLAFMKETGGFEDRVTPDRIIADVERLLKQGA